MNDEDVRVSVLINEQDVHLLREIAKWRRAQGVNYFQWRPGVGFGVFTEWYRYMDGKRRTVSFEPGSMSSAARLLATVDYHGRELQRLPVTTVTEAVDVLVALGFLPARFSSAYQSGWAARSAWDGTPVRLTGDDGQPLVPAVEVAW
jgi:hypothetical protein